MLKNQFCRTPLESFPVFWKSAENFNPEYLTSPMLAGSSFTENINADVPVEIFRNILKQYPQLFCWRIYQLLLKVISL